ncbi:MAG TPA: hypothetical protein VL977_08705 [Solirubrobacteraceae bacterium]|nr:hypothetical protein [Solirubrobacteraceae bacterium]
MFWRLTHTSQAGAVRRALDLVRAVLLLDAPPYDWAAETEWAHDGAGSRALQPQFAAAIAGHGRASRPGRPRSRGGAVLERPQECLSPIGARRTPQVRSRPSRCALSKRAVGR